MICYYQNKKAIIIFSEEADIKILIYTVFLKAIYISQKILFVIILKWSFYLNKQLEISYYYFMN